MLGHQAARGQMRTPPQSVALPTALPHQSHGQLQPQAAQQLFGGAASTASRPHSHEVLTHLLADLYPGKAHVTGQHQSQQGLHSQETSGQPLSQPAHSLGAVLPAQAGASATAARSEQHGSPLPVIAHKAQTGLQASMQQPTVSEACLVQHSQQEQHRVQAPTGPQTGQHFLTERSAQPPQQQQQHAQELQQPLQVPQALGQDAGSAAPEMDQQREQPRPHAQEDGHDEGVAGGMQGSWSSTEGDDDFADWEQHILASAAPEPAGADVEQQDASMRDFRGASMPP